ncbi:MAG: hypothetical protein Q9169_004136 [Polycauliona sp. 2 TL-2023]
MAGLESPQEVHREGFPWHLGVFDAHCHPTDTIASLDDIPKMKARALTIMATRGQDQHLVCQFARKYGVDETSLTTLRNQTHIESSKCIVPSFGWHPWFSHEIYDDTGPVTSEIQKPDVVQHYLSVLTPPPDNHDFISSLPEPKSFSELLTQMRNNLEEFSYALVGEIGIDRSFRLPMHWVPDEKANRDDDLTPGGREGRHLTPYRVQIDHQRRIMKAQLDLAGALNRPVSIHGVAAHGIVYETLKETWKDYEREIPSKKRSKRKSNAAVAYGNGTTPKHADGEGKHVPTGTKPYPPRICLHSFSGPLDTLKQYLAPAIPATIYFSFSCLVNLSSRTDKAFAVIEAVPDDQILVESDLHSAGDRMDELLEDVVRSVCKIKGWTLTAGVNQLAQNWKRFVFGQQGA